MDIKHVTSPDGDWEGLYVDGRLAREGHSLDVRHVLEALKLEFEHHEADPDWMYRMGSLPNTFEEVQIQ